MKTLTAAQQQAHDRFTATLPVTTVAAKPPTPRPYDIVRREEATKKMLASRKANANQPKPLRVNTWVEVDPTPKRAYYRRGGKR